MESIHRKDSLFSSVWALIKDGNASISGGSPLVLLSYAKVPFKIPLRNVIILAMQNDK